MFEGNQLCSSPSEYHPKSKVCWWQPRAVEMFFRSRDWGTHQNTRQVHQNIEIVFMKTQSRAFRSSEWAEASPSNRTMTLNTQQEWLIDNSVNVLEWPSHSLGLNPIKYFWRNLKMCVCPIHPERAWEMKRWGEEWQINAKCWWAKLVTNKKRLETVKVLQLNV